jgi:hypothetical protein
MVVTLTIGMESGGPPKKPPYPGGTSGTMDLGAAIANAITHAAMAVGRACALSPVQTPPLSRTIVQLLLLLPRLRCPQMFVEQSFRRPVRNGRRHTDHVGNPQKRRGFSGLRLVASCGSRLLLESVQPLQMWVGLPLSMAFLVSGTFLGCAPTAPRGLSPERSVPSDADRHLLHEQLPQPWFRNVSPDRHLDTINDPGPHGSYFMPQSMGTGAALLDADGDGRLDIYLLNAGGPDSNATNQLFLQMENGDFRNASAGSGCDLRATCCGVAVGDVDQDGRVDLCISGYGMLSLLLNEGHGHFRDVSGESGLINDDWATSAAFCDYDRDGRLDLVLVKYVAYEPESLCYHGDGGRDFCGPQGFAGVPAALFHNVTPSSGQPRFVDVSEASGLAARPAAGLGLLCADFNDDGWDDLFIANDQDANHLWINRQDGTFAEEGLLRGVATDVVGKAAANMGVAWGDIDGDGREDLFVTHLDSELHTLWRQESTGFFLDATSASGLTQARRGTGFGTVLADFDLDGDLDLALVNGRIRRGPPAEAAGLSTFWQAYAQLNDLLLNDGSGGFTDFSRAGPALCGTPNVARPLCAGDIDNDGDVDLLVGTTAGRPLLLENTAPRQGHWLMVRALERTVGRDAYGALVTVEAGGQRWRRLVQPGSSYLSSHDPRVHFGLGDASRVDAITIRWPDGRRERFPGCSVDTHVALRQGEGQPE